MHYEAVTVLREFWRMSESQQKTLLSEGVSRHVWERCPLAGHSVFFMTRAWEIGRMTAYVKNYSFPEGTKKEHIVWLAKRHSRTMWTHG